MSKYQQELCYGAYYHVCEAIKALQEINHNIAFVDEVWLENCNLGHIEQMLQDVSNSLYTKAEQFDKEAQDGQ